METLQTYSGGRELVSRKSSIIDNSPSRLDSHLLIVFMNAADLRQWRCRQRCFMRIVFAPQGCRTEPGVSTPGISNERVRPEGSVRSPIVTGVEYSIVYLSVWRPCRARRGDGEIQEKRGELFPSPDFSPTGGCDRVRAAGRRFPARSDLSGK
jgi:hypothetical protein